MFSGFVLIDRLQTSRIIYMLLLKCQILMSVSETDITKMLPSEIFNLKWTDICTTSMSKENVDCPEVSGIHTVEIISFILRAILADSVDIDIVFCKMQTIRDTFRIGIALRTLPIRHMVMNILAIEQIRP